MKMIKQMSKFEWILRCQRQFAKRTNDYSYDWSMNAEICYDEMREGWYENDPEGCADEEISNWD